MKHYLNGKLVDMTEEDMAQAKASYGRDMKVKATEKWKHKMAATDVALPRPMEDIIDVLTEEQKAKLNRHTLAAYQNKKTLRANKPA